MMTADSSGPVRSGTLTSDLACANCLLAFTSPLQQLPIRKGVIENKFFLGPVKFVRLILRCLVVSSGMDRRIGMKLFYALVRVTLCQCSYRILFSLGFSQPRQRQSLQSRPKRLLQRPIGWTLIPRRLKI